VRLGVWVPFRAGGSLGPPESLPLGRAALLLEREHGLTLVLGSPRPQGRFSGVVARPGAWQSVQDLDVHAVYDRFPSASRPGDFAEGRAALGPTLLGNAPEITALCRDKLRCQQVLQAAGLPLPVVTAEREGFAQALEAWGAAFLKPREGSFGRDVRRVEPGDDLPTSGDWVLQRAVEPPERFGAGLALRVLVQRGRQGQAVVRSPVGRQSDEDPVVNAARGARVLPARDLDLGARGLQGIHELAARTLEVLAAVREPVLELGVDIVLDAQEQPWILEVNSRPRGRLRALAQQQPERFTQEHAQACVLPFLRLADLARDGAGEGWR